MTPGVLGLLDLVVKATAILLTAAAVAGSMRRASTASRHVVWTTALGATLLLPLARVVTPIWQVRVLPAVRDDTAAIPPTPVGAPAPPRIESAPTMPDNQRSAPRPTPISSGTGLTFESVDRLLVSAWILGVLGLAMRAAVGARRIRRTAQQATPAAPSVLARAGRLSDDLQIGRPVSTLISATVDVPMTWGVRTPILLLPANAASWSDRRLDAVLAHELAHVARHDALTHGLGRIACAAVWFHPLVWFATSQAHLEMERACDDIVLARGTRASCDAHDLLALSRTLGAGLTTGSLAIARRSQIQSRLVAILDATVNRRGRSRASLGIAASLLALLWPIAAVHLAARLSLIVPTAAGVTWPPAIVAVAPKQVEQAVSAPTSAPRLAPMQPSIPKAEPPPVRPAPVQAVVPPAMPIEPQQTVAPAQTSATPARPNFSGRWVPVSPSDAQQFFNVGLSRIPGNGMTISQNDTTLTITKRLPADELQALASIGVGFEPERTFRIVDPGSQDAANSGDVGALRAQWSGDRLVTGPVDGYTQVIYSLEGDELRVDTLLGKPVVSYFKRAPSGPVVDHVNFSGTWTGDTDRAQPAIQIGVMAMADLQTVFTVVQDAATMTVSFVRGRTDVYRLDGISDGKGFYYVNNYEPITAVWDGDRLVVTEGKTKEIYAMDAGDLSYTSLDANGAGAPLFYKRVK